MDSSGSVGWLKYKVWFTRTQLSVRFMWHRYISAAVSEWKS